MASVALFGDLLEAARVLKVTNFNVCARSFCSIMERTFLLPLGTIYASFILYK